MSDVINLKLKSFLVSSLIQSLKNQNPSSWKPETYYNLGSSIVSNDKIYVATSTGTSGVTPPSHGTGLFLDGNVTWLFLKTATSSSDISSNLYLGVGKPNEWNEDDTPETPLSTTTYEDKTFEELIYLIKISSTDLRNGLKINNWATGTVYSMFDPDIKMSDYGNTIPDLYVMVDDHIYKCIDNNGGAESSDEPTGTQLGLVLMSDGYIWKYMATLDALDKIRFTTDEFVPVSIKETNDSSDQWDVQQEAKDGSISSFKNFVTVGDFFESEPTATIFGTGTGATAAVDYNESSGEFTLTRVYATAGGQDYDRETYAVVKGSSAAGAGATVDLLIEDGEITLDDFVGGSGYSDGAVLVIIGDGEDAEGTLTISSGVVTVVDITNSGSGYTWAKGFVIPGGCGAVSKALMAPVGGHGKNIITELGAKTSIISKEISDTLDPYVIEGEFRQLSLLSGVEATENFRLNAAAYIGPKHPDYVSNPDNLDKYKIGSGHILYINNIEAVSHEAEQTETIKIALTF